MGQNERTTAQGHSHSHTILFVHVHKNLVTVVDTGAFTLICRAGGRLSLRRLDGPSSFLKDLQNMNYVTNTVLDEGDTKASKTGGYHQIV